MGPGRYGDVPYADPGYQYDGRPRYPVDSPGRIRDAWARIHQRGNALAYTPHELARIETSIRAAARRSSVELREHGAPLHRLAVGVPRRRRSAHSSAVHRHTHR